MNKSLWNSQNYVGSEKHAHTHASFEQSHLSSFKKTLDAERSSTWKSHHLHTALTRAVWHGLDAHPVTGILHGILVEATMSRTTSPRLWNAFATSAFTDDDKDPWGMMCQLKPEGKKVIGIQGLTCFSSALPAVLGWAIPSSHTSLPGSTEAWYRSL